MRPCRLQTAVLSTVTWLALLAASPAAAQAPPAGPASSAAKAGAAKAGPTTGGTAAAGTAKAGTGSGAPAGTPSPGAASNPPQVLLTARRAHNKALEAFAKEDYLAAYNGFLEARDLQGEPPIPRIVGNLGRAELKLGKYCDAAEHLAFFLTKEQGLSPTDKEEFNRQLTEANLHKTMLRVEVVQAGAQVSIDGTAVGRAPIGHEVCVDPGQRKVEAKLDDRRAEKVLDLRGGASETVKLDLSPPDKRDETPLPPPAEPFPTRIVIIAGGSTLAAGGIAAGIGLFVASEGKVSEVKEASGSLGGKAGDPANVRCDTTERKKICADNATKLSDSDVLGNAGRAMFVVGGALAVGTVVYALLGPRPRNAGLRILPIAGAREGGVIIQGAW